MTPEIGLTLLILFLAIVLFVTERLRVDVMALLVLGALALSGLVTPAEALSGFSSPGGDILMSHSTDEFLTFLGCPEGRT